MGDSHPKGSRGEPTIVGTSMVWVSLLIFAASNSVVSLLSELGAMHPIDGRNAISFCNLLFVGNLCAFLSLSAIYWRSWSPKNLSGLSGRDWANLLLVAVLSGALAPTLIFFALEKTTVTNILLVGRIEPPLLLICSALFFKEKVDRWAIAGTFITVIGALVIFGLQYQHDPMAFGSGELYAGIAAVIWVVVTLVSVQYLHHVPIGIFAIIRTLVGALVFAAIVVALFGADHFQDALSPFLWKWMLVYGGVIIVIGQLLWYKGITMTSAAQVSLASAFTPIAGVIFAVMLLGETLSMPVIAGGSIIVLGIATAQLGPVLRRRREMRGEAATGKAVKLEGGVNFKGA